MKAKIIIENKREAEFLNHLIHTGLLNMDRNRIEEFFPEFANDRLGITFMIKDNSDYVYGAREIESGKLVSDITNPRKKYWQQENACKQAISKHNSGRSFSRYGKLELVKFRLVEEADEVSG